MANLAALMNCPSRRDRVYFGGYAFGTRFDYGNIIADYGASKYTSVLAHNGHGGGVIPYNSEPSSNGAQSTNCQSIGPD